MRLSPARPKSVRRAAAVAAVALSATMLTGCFGEPEPESNAVGFDDLKDATVRIYAEGTFVEQGTLEPVEGGWYGSGFIIDPSGLIVTNYHVAGGAESMVVWIGDDNDDGDEIEAELVGYSECLDLALIQLEDDDDDYPYLDWYEGKITEGLDVYSAGFPGGDPNFTLTRGIVSKSDFEREFSWSSLEHVIEHDARIRGGNSGGPLVDEEGRVVGVNYAGDGGADDYNWAIHRDEVLDVLEDLEDGDLVLSLGMSVRALYPDDGGSWGVWVQAVQEGGPAEDLGILAGDVIITMDGDDLAVEGTLQEYCDIIDDEGPDGEIAVEVYRPSEDAYYEGVFNNGELEFVGYGDGGSTIAGFQLVKDATGVIEVSLPIEWSDVDGAGFTDASGNQYLSLLASPSIEGFQSTWTTPGVRLLASQALAGADISAELERFVEGFDTQCTVDDEGDFDDGLYVGKYRYFTECGGTQTELAGLVVTDYDKTHIMYLGIQMVSGVDKTTVLNEVLATFLARY